MAETTNIIPAEQIKRLFVKIYSQHHADILASMPVLSTLVNAPQSLESGKLFRLPNIEKCHKFLNKFYGRIFTKFDNGEDILSAAHLLGKKMGGTFTTIYDFCDLLGRKVAICNTKAFLSLLNIPFDSGRMESYLSNPNRPNYYNFLNREPWDDTFIQRLAALYVSIAYYEYLFLKPTLMPLENTFNALLEKEDHPDDIANKYSQLREYIIFFFKKLDVGVELPDIMDLIPEEDYAWDGTLLIPWRYVTFKSGSLLIDHPKFYSAGGSKQAYKYKCHQAQAAFNYIKKAFISKLPPVIAKCERGIITEIVNIGDINICVTALETGVLPPKIKIKSSRKVTVESAINYDEFIRRRKAYKSIYLDYLAEHLYHDSTIYFSKECRLNADGATTYEDAFIFRLANNILLYENVLDNRASVLFTIDDSQAEKCIEIINDYFSSHLIVNKREKIASDITQFLDSGIKDYKRIYHTTLHEWETELLAYINGR